MGNFSIFRVNNHLKLLKLNGQAMAKLNDIVQKNLESGQQALASYKWQEARDCFNAATLIEETAESLEYLGQASWWLNDAAATFSSREKAYRLYRKIGDNRSAARVATVLAIDYFTFYGEYAVSNGWSRRAHRLLDKLKPSAEHALIKFYDGHVALEVHHDPATSFRLGLEMEILARRLNEFDLEMLGIAVQGLALVCKGNVQEGMQKLDEATAAAIAGEVIDLDISNTICCYLICACERVRDYNRAVQWCFQVKDATGDGKYPMMFSLCPIHYSGVLIWQGDWNEAEKILYRATEDLIATQHAQASEGILLRADLCRLKGRTGEAAELIRQAGKKPFRMLGANRVLLSQAALAYDQNDLESASMLLERYRGNIKEACKLALPPALELLCLVQVSLGEYQKAARTAADLSSIAGMIGTEPLLASASLAEGTVLLARGDYQEAYKKFEVAEELFEKNKSPFETARARCGLSQSLHLLGQKKSALAEIHLALETFEKLEAVTEKQRANAILKKIRSVPAGLTEEALPEAFTKRELEILLEIAAGKDNAQISNELFISIRTTERHVSNIYGKIGATGTAARAIATAFALRHQLL
ncbi:hypothetical protein BH23BAC1_BH23BAC1_33080 [soil metagenome]